MKLSFLEISGLARLRTMPEFQILLDALASDLENAADKIYFAENDQDERRAVAEWRALRLVLARLRGLPEAVSDEADSIRNNLGFVPEVPNTETERKILQNMINSSFGLDFDQETQEHEG